MSQPNPKCLDSSRALTPVSWQLSIRQNVATPTLLAYIDNGLT